MNVKELIANWDVRREENAKKFIKHFPETDDILAIVLRGHLIIEGFLDQLNRHCFHFPEYYDQANFQFSKKILIARAQVLVPHENPDSFFEGMKRLNELRNRLAHNLEPPNLQTKINEFLEVVESSYSEEAVKSLHQKKEPIEKRLRSAISYMLGQLVVMDMVVEFMEKSRGYGASTSEQGSPADG